MSQQAGFQLYGQTMNGILDLTNVQSIEAYEIYSENINTDTLTVNNLLTVPQISNTQIGTITQTGTNIITQTGTGTNILKNTDISGNLTVSGSLTYDIIDIDCEDITIRGNLIMTNNLNSIINQPTKTSSPGFPITPNHLSLTNIQGLTVEDSLNVIGYGFFNNNITQLADGNNTFRGNTDISGTLYTPNTIVRGNLTAQQKSIFIGDVSMNNLVVQNDASFNKINVSGNTNLNNVNINGNLIVQQKTNFIGDVSMNNLIVQQDASFNRVNISGNLRIENVLTTDENLFLQDFIFDETSYLTGLFVGTPTKIFSFNVFGNNRPITFTVDYSTPLALSENNTASSNLSGVGSIINSAIVNLYRNGTLISTTYGTKYYSNYPNYSITTGVFNYKQFVNIITGSITITDTYSATTPTLYELKMSFNNTRQITTGGTYGYEANTLETGITKSANVTNYQTYSYSAGAYTVTVSNQTPTYTTDTGTLINNSLVNNDIYNSKNITNLGNIINSGNITNLGNIINSGNITNSQTTTTHGLVNTTLINNYISITTTPYTLVTTNSYYFISRASDVQINLPNLSNIYTGFTVYLRTAPPTRNADTIIINCLTGVSYYHDNLTPTNAFVNYNSSVAFHLFYAGSGDWYLLNSFVS